MAIARTGMEIILNHTLCTSLDQAEKAVTPDVAAFLKEWYDESPYVIGHTSGSTGTPKEIRLLKSDMLASAQITNRFFQIGAGSKMLLCLSPAYIAGKMMIVRALSAKADLLCVPPASLPLKTIEEPVQLAAMVPAQVAAILSDPEETSRLSFVSQLIVGGAVLSPEVERRLSELPVVSYATYGMTETVSHIALRKVGCSNSYFALGDVTFSTDERGCLVIDAPHLSARRFVTNDVVTWVDSRRFEWVGRYDHVINTGGVKVFPEQIERKIASLLDVRYFITSLPDEKWGEKVVLAIESPQPDEATLGRLRVALATCLNRYEMPKEIRFLSRFQETYSGKVVRRLNV